MAKRIKNPNDGGCILIIGGQNASLANGVDATLDHMLSGAKNERVEIIQGTAQDARDMHGDAKASGRLKHWAHCFMVAPQLDRSRHTMLTVILPLLARKCKFPATEAIVFEHALKRRGNAGSGTHWHVIVNYRDPITGKIRNWSFDRITNEVVSRTLEVLLGEKIQRGRHHYAVLKALREADENHIADAIERAIPPDAEPAGRTPRRQVEQPAQAQGVDLRETGALVRTAFDAADNNTKFRELLAKVGLSLVVSYRVKDRPAWTIHNSKGFLRSLGGALAGTSLKQIIEKIGEPHEENDTAGSGGVGDADVGVDRNATALESAGDAGVFRVDYQLGPHVEGGAAQVLVRAALRNPERAETLRDRLLSLIKGAGEVAGRFLAQIVQRATDFLANIAPHRKMQPNSYVVALRDELAALQDEQAAAQEVWGKAEVRVIELTLAPVPTLASAHLAHRGRIATAKKERDVLAEKLAKAKADVEACVKRNRSFEEHYERQNAEYRRTVIADQISAAQRALDVSARVEGLIKEKPELLWMGAPAMVRYGLIEAKKALANARFLINASPKPNDENDNDTGVTLQPK
jgi:hypothetical protein